MSGVVICDVCGRRVPPHGHYVLKMDLYADPTMPAVTSDELQEMDFEQGMKELMAQMEQMTAADLQDQVHRRFEFRLCPACHARVLANPLGLPRTTNTGAN